jgi:hypothetical protein
MTVPLIEPNTVREPRQSQLDLRLSKVIRIARVRMVPSFDVYNVFNASNVLTNNAAYGSTWLKPISTVAGRLAKFAMQVDF